MGVLLLLLCFNSAAAYLLEELEKPVSVHKNANDLFIAII